MDYKEPKKRVTKNDKKKQRQVFTQKHIRIKTDILEKKIKNGSIQSPQYSLFSNGRI